MATVKEVYQALDRFAPFGTQMGFDNAGFLVGRGETTVRRALVSLDITLPVIREAKALDAQLVVSHHPVIFDPVKAIVDGDPVGDKLLELIENGISAICAHTNLDLAVGGVNDALAEALGLNEVQVFLPEGTDDQGRPFGLGRIGFTDRAYTPEEYGERVKTALGSGGVRLVEGKRPVHRVAVGGGACGGNMRDAWEKGCDAFVTSDVKYDVFLDAKALGITLIDAGHFPTENVVLPVLRKVLTDAFPGMEVCVSQVHHEVFSYL